MISAEFGHYWPEAGEYDTSLNVDLRMNVYRHTEDGRNLDQELVDALNLQAGDVVLDVGCSRGKQLDLIRERSPDIGLAVGVDNAIGSLMLANGEVGPRYVGADVMKLPFRAATADKALAQFMLYHTEDPKVAVAEMYHVLKPGGTLVVATSGPNNKQLHRKFEADIAGYLSSEFGDSEHQFEPSPKFSASFNSQNALPILGSLFSVIELEPQNTKIVLDTEEKIADYILSLQAMKDSFSPIPSANHWSRAIDSVVLPILKAESTQEEMVDRHLYVCKKPL